MTAQTAWLVAIFAVVITGVVGFFVGRQFGAGKARIEELESEVARQKGEIEAYRQEVATHFDKTATLFVSMAGSYKELFEHLSSGYEKLSSGSARELFQQRVDALLVGNDRDGGSEKLLAATGLAAAAGAAGVAAASVQTGEAASAAPDEGSAPGTAVAEDAAAEPVPVTDGADELATPDPSVQPAAAASPAGERADDGVPMVAADVPAESAETDTTAEAKPDAQAEAPALVDDPLAEEVVGHHAELRREDVK